MPDITLCSNCHRKLHWKGRIKHIEDKSELVKSGLSKKKKVKLYHIISCNCYDCREGKSIKEKHERSHKYKSNRVK